MSDVTAQATNINKPQQLKSAADREVNASKKKNVSKQKPTKAELLKSYIYNDLGDHLSDAVKRDINSDEPFRVINFDYGDREKRNNQWVQYMKPEIISKNLIGIKSRGPFCVKVFSAVLISILITGGVALVPLIEPMIATVLSGVIGLGLLMGSIFLFLFTFSIMFLPCCMQFPCNVCCYVLLTASSSIISGVIVTHSNGAEFILAFIVIAIIIFLFLILACYKIEFTEPYLYVMAVTLVLCLFSIGIFILSVVMDIRVILSHIFLALMYSILYVICVILQVQMILGARGIELTKHDWLFGAATVLIAIVFVFKNILQMIHQYNLI